MARTNVLAFFFVIPFLNDVYPLLIDYIWTLIRSFWLISYYYSLDNFRVFFCKCFLYTFRTAGAWVVWVFTFLYTFRTAGAWVVWLFTFLYTFRTAGAADLDNSILFLCVSCCGLTHQIIS